MKFEKANKADGNWLDRELKNKKNFIIKVCWSKFNCGQISNYWN